MSPSPWHFSQKNAYWSWRADTGNVQGGTMQLSNSDPMDKRHYLTAVNQNLVHDK